MTPPAQLGKASFAPLLFRFAARLEQLPWDEFVEDAAYASQALRTAQAAAGSSSIVSWFDTWAEAEHLGLVEARLDDGSVEAGEQRLGEVAGVAERLEEELGPRLAALTTRIAAERAPGTTLVAAATGPATLSARLWTASPGEGHEPEQAMEQAGRWLVSQARSHFEAGADVFLVAEEDLAGLRGEPSSWGRAVDPVLKLARYYGRSCLLLARRGLTPEVAGWAGAAGLEVVGEPARLAFGGGGPRQRWQVLDADVLQLPEDAWDAALADLEASDEAGTHLTSWEVSPDVEPERLVQLGSLFGPT